MTTDQILTTCLLVYVAGFVIVSVGVGEFTKWRAFDQATASIMWPILVIAFAVFIICVGPSFLGKQLRKALSHDDTDADAAVGRWVYTRISTLMNAEPGTAEGAELAYLAALVSDVEEYGATGEHAPPVAYGAAWASLADTWQTTRFYTPKPEDV